MPHMHNVVVFLSVVSLLCAGQAHAQSKVDVYTFSDASCRTPLTSVFPSQPQQLNLSRNLGNSPPTCSSGPCLWETGLTGVYSGPLILGFDSTGGTPTTCTGRGMFQMYKLVRLSDGRLAKIWQEDLNAAACHQLLGFSVYIVVVPSFCPKPSLCTTCTASVTPYYFGPSISGSDGFCDVQGNYSNTDDFKYCSDRVWYRYYRGDCINGSKPRALKMSSMSCYTSCSACITYITYTWRSTVSSNPGTLGVCTSGDDYKQNSTISSYPYYFNQDSGCSSAVVTKTNSVSASSVTNAKMLFPFFQFFAAAYLLCLL